MDHALAKPREPLVEQRFAGRKGFLCVRRVTAAATVAVSAGRRATVKQMATAKTYQARCRCFRSKLCLPTCLAYVLKLFGRNRIALLRSLASLDLR